jgi:hypothetical protein
MYFDEFIMPSTGNRLPAPLSEKTPRTFLESILQSPEDA